MKNTPLTADYTSHSVLFRHWIRVWLSWDRQYHLLWHTLSLYIWKVSVSLHYMIMMILTISHQMTLDHSDSDQTQSNNSFISQLCFFCSLNTQSAPRRDSQIQRKQFEQIVRFPHLQIIVSTKWELFERNNLKVWPGWSQF